MKRMLAGKEIVVFTSYIDSNEAQAILKGLRKELDLWLRFLPE
jgi:hypothetical protein